MNGRQLLACCGMTGLALALGGCPMSIEPVVAEADGTVDARLVGRWAEIDGDDHAVVARQGGGYAITFVDGGDTGRYAARLGRLGDRVVLDVWPAPAEGEVRATYRDLLIPAHMTFAVEIGADTVRLAALVTDSLTAAIRDGRMRLTAAHLGDRLVLQGTTAELRMALAAHLGRPGTLDRAAAFRRISRAP